MIFISHSSVDDVFVDTLRATLMKHGHQVWVDHHNIPAGYHWDDVVEQALKQSAAMVLVLSPDAVSSRNVKVEWHEFREMEKPIVPVKYRECVMPLLIRHLNYLDFTDNETHEYQFKRLTQSLPAVQQRPTMTREFTDVDVSDSEIYRIQADAHEIQPEAETILGDEQVLFVFTGMRKSILADLDNGKLFVGCQYKWTDPKPDVDLTRFDAAENGVSRQHLLLERTRNGLVVTDLGSRNGTYINRRRLPPHKPVPLRNRSVVHVGKLAAQVMYKLRTR